MKFLLSMRGNRTKGVSSDFQTLEVGKTTLLGVRKSDETAEVFVFDRYIT